MSSARRNVELKAIDRDPAATLRAALATGATDAGTLVQRDTYFAVAHGRLKLREEADRATLIAYARPDAAAARVSAYHLIGVDDPGAALAGLTATHGVRVVVAKRRRLLLLGCVRVHLDDVDGLPPHLELEGVVAPAGDAAEPAARDVDGGARGAAASGGLGAPAPDEASAAAEVAQLREALGIRDEDLREGSYSDMLAPRANPRALDAARAAQAHAYAPYSKLHVGAAVVTASGDVFAGANVENAAYPQGNCAEASALAAMATAGERAITQVVVASELGVAPCGGCRQRLKEFGGPETEVFLADATGVHTTLTLADLLPHAFAAADLPPADGGGRGSPPPAWTTSTTQPGREGGAA